MSDCDFHPELTGMIHSDKWGQVPVLMYLGELNPWHPPDPKWREQLGPVLYLKSEDVWGWMSQEVPPGCQYSWLTMDIAQGRIVSADKYLRITFSDDVTLVWRSRSVASSTSYEYESEDYDYRSNIYRFIWPD